MKIRCEWCKQDPLYVSYHDHEWGVPLHEDQRLFEMIVLEGAQSGLSWLTILKKRENYRNAFDHFNIEKVASYTMDDINNFLANPGIVRNRLKVASAVKNAAAALRVIEKHGSLDAFLWRFVDYRPIQNRWKSVDAIPPETSVSKSMSRDLKKHGFSFIGPVTCYAFMQSIGMVNDHVEDCFRYAEIKKTGEITRRQNNKDGHAD